MRECELFGYRVFGLEAGTTPSYVVENYTGGIAEHDAESSPHL